ncbi:phage tail protein [Budviciaceae bacterium CWB-B4]|uniref:Phage tail protein n=1 Tax=Limnobaculum xujianqingii TaxID=2738837 RepID=A0A9D7FTJ6_9GAMM|nr:phage tail protein [Limnobaculum xujianqingii]MBK5073230.1 phage tail protein [Limnobaculum xujianqingii]MBK5176539.1 phage tail protein [Limnobaculum xujianqingii]
MIRMRVDAGQMGISSRLLRQLGPNADKALADASNRTAAGMRTDATRLIVKDSGLKRPVIFTAFRIVKASGKVGGSSAQVIIDGSPLPLFLNAPKPSKPMTGKTKGGVTVKLGARRVNFQHAFIAQMASGRVGIFERQVGVRGDSGREKIRELYGPSVPQLAERDHITEEVNQKARERFNQRFNQQADRHLRRMGVR